MCDLHNSFAHLLIEVQKKYTFVQHLHQKSTILTNPTPLDTGKGALYGLSTIQRASVCICRSTVLDLITQPRRTDLFLRRTAGRGNLPVRPPTLCQPRYRYPDRRSPHHKCIRIHHIRISSFLLPPVGFSMLQTSRLSLHFYYDRECSPSSMIAYPYFFFNAEILPFSFLFSALFPPYFRLISAHPRPHSRLPGAGVSR